MKNLTNIAILAIAALTSQACFSTRSTTSRTDGTATFGSVAPASGNRTSRSPGNTFTSDGNGTAISPTTGAKTVTEAVGAMGTANTTGNYENESRPGSTTSSEEAAHFIQQAAVSGMSEVTFSKLALKNAQSSAAKNFAAMMVKEHGAANAELKALAETKDITLQDSGTLRMEELTASTAKDFDKKYAALMIRNHTNAVRLFENGSKSSDPEVKAYATKYLPVLRMHLQQAKDLGKTVNDKSGMQ